jgi:hypothetical protein
MFRGVVASSTVVLALCGATVAGVAAQSPAPAPAAQPATPAAGTPAAPAATPAAPNAATPENAAPFLGDWTITAEGPNGPAVFALSVKSNEGKVTADISSDQQPLQTITDVTRSESSLVLRYMFDYQGMAVPVVVTLKPANDTVGAQLDFADGAYVMTGTAAKKKA